MERVRGEVVWETLSLTQRNCLKNNLLTDYQFRSECSWSQLSPGQQEALLKIDWEFTLGTRFPQLKQTKEK